MGEQGEIQEPARVAVPGPQLAQALRDALTGAAHQGAAQVIWSDRGSELIMDVSSLQVQTGKGSLVVAANTVTTEFGAAPLIVRFAFGSSPTAGALVAATDATALGHPLLAARWGELFRGVVWSAIVRYLVARAADQKLAPTGVQVAADGLTLHLDQHVPITDLARSHLGTDPLRRTGVTDGTDPA